MISIYHFRTLGELSLREGTVEGPEVLGPSKPLAVLAYLAVAPDRTARRSRLASLLWAAVDATRGRRSLRQALYYLSQQVEHPLVDSDGGRLILGASRLEVDLWAFDEALEREAWAEAVDAYGGSFMAGFRRDVSREFREWIDVQDERVASGLRAAYQELLTRSLDAGDHPTALARAREYVELDPLSDAAQRFLIRAHLVAGDRVGAYRAYESYRTLLDEALGDTPARDLEERMRQLQAELFRAPSVEVPAAEAPGPGAAPEKGPGIGEGSKLLAAAVGLVAILGLGTWLVVWAFRATGSGARASAPAGTSGGGDAGHRPGAERGGG